MALTDDQAAGTPEQPTTAPAPAAPAPVTLDLSKATPINQPAPTAPVTLDMSKAVPITSSQPPESGGVTGSWEDVSPPTNTAEYLKQAILHPVKTAVQASNALQTRAAYRRNENLKASAAGHPLPYHEGATQAMQDLAGFESTAASPYTSWKNAALTGALAIPGLDAVAGGYLAAKGTQMVTAPRGANETEADYVQRITTGASLIAGGAGAVKSGIDPLGEGISAAAEKTGNAIAHPINTAVDLAKGPANLLDAATLRRVFGYSPREIDGTEVTGQRSLANLAQGPINRSMGAAPRDVRYGDPAAGLINNNIAAPTNFGRLQAVNQVLDDISPKVDAALAANPKTIPVDDIINDSIKDASDAIHKSKMTPMEKRTANRQLEALREEEEKGDYSLVEANDVKQRIGDQVNWETRPTPMSTPVEDAYRSAYGQIRKAIDKAAPDVAGMNLNRTNLIAAQHALQDALLHQKIGQGPLAQSMGIFNPREWGAVAGHVLSPVLAPFGHAPEVEPEVGAAAGLPPELVPTTTALQSALDALRKEPNQTPDQEALANQLEQELQKQGEAARAKARTQESMQPFKKAGSAAPTNPTNGAGPTAPTPTSGPPVAAEQLEASPKKQSAYEHFVSNAIKRSAQEAYGQGILGDMVDHNISPKDVSQTFWKDTYFKLPSESQNIFQRYLYKLTGFKPGDTIGSDASGRPIVAHDWIDIAQNTLDLGNDASLLEGTERGLVSGMKEANDLTGANPKSVAPENH